MTIPSLVLLGALQLATPQRMLISTSDDVDLAAESGVSDCALIARELGQPAQSWLGAQGWHALLGDLDGDGAFELPEGIDALSFGPRPGGMARGPAVLWFSVERDGWGVQDGDVLRLSAVGALEVVYSEADLLQALQPVTGNPDLDALCRLDDGSLLLSLRDGLNGTVLGDVQDGDILHWFPGSGVITIFADEAHVQGWVDHATGGASSVGDVKGITRESTGETLFTVQSPSSDDATVYGDAGGGRVVSGWEEASWSFQSSAEIDALALLDVVGLLPMQLKTSQSVYAPGDLVTLEVRHAAPGESLQIALGRAETWMPVTGGGFELLVLDVYAASTRILGQVGGTLLQADGQGRAMLSKRVPAHAGGAGGHDLLVQVNGVASGLSAPLRLMLQ